MNCKAFGMTRISQRNVVMVKEVWPQPYVRKSGQATKSDPSATASLRLIERLQVSNSFVKHLLSSHHKALLIYAAERCLIEIDI
jgi:hypothetical protein